MDDFDDNVLSNILNKVPAKTLVGLKVINKQWYSLISDPTFIVNHPSHCSGYKLAHGHFNYHPSSPATITKSSSLGLPLHKGDYSAIILSCSYLDNDNLQLVKTSSIFYYICNPITKRYRRIPDPDINRRYESRFGIVVDPLAFPKRKVVCVYGLEVENFESIYRFKIFTLDMNKRWVHSDKGTISCRPGKISKSCGSVYYRGVVHWVRERRDILAFDVKQEKSCMIDAPQGIEQLVFGAKKQLPDPCWFGLAEGLLNLISISHEEIVVWVLHDYENKKWQIRRRIKKTWTTWLGRKFNATLYSGDRLVLVAEAQGSQKVEAYIYNTRTSVWESKDLKLVGG